MSAISNNVTWVSKEIQKLPEKPIKKTFQLQIHFNYWKNSLNTGSNSAHNCKLVFSVFPNAIYISACMQRAKELIRIWANLFY